MSAISGIDGVVDVHHLHIWGISTTEVAMTVHVIVKDGASVDRVICDVRHLASGMAYLIPPLRRRLLKMTAILVHVDEYC